MRVLLLVVTTLALSACSIIYKLPTRQGNIIAQNKIDQLKLGMTPDQVHYLMGTPIASSAFRPDRWDYVGYYKSPRGEVTERVISLYFTDDVLARMEGTAAPETQTKAVDTPDVAKVLNEQKQDEKQNARSESEPKGGIVVTPGGQQP